MVRTRHITSLKSILSSIADVAGDWIFVFSASVEGTRYLLPAQISSVFGSILAFFTILQALRTSCFRSSGTSTADARNGGKCCCSISKRGLKAFCLPLLSWKDVFQLLEIFLEDLPQIVMSILLRLDGGSWTPSIVLNVTTSTYNFIFDMLNILEEEKCEHCGKEYCDHPTMSMGGGSSERASSRAGASSRALAY